MSSLPQVTGRRLVRALKKAGFVLMRQSGGHAVLRHPSDMSRRAIIPMHGSKNIKQGTLRAILRGAGLSPDQLKKLL